MKSYLPADYVQLITYTLFFNTELGRPYIRFELCLFVIYSCEMEKRDILITLQFSPISHYFTGHALSDLEENRTDHET